jgi:glutamyl-tRNA synthetase
MSTGVRTRFSACVTEQLDVSDARTALYSWFFARHGRGKFALCLDDTHRTDADTGGTVAICDTLRWLGLDWDEGPYAQSERLPFYRRRALWLVEQDKAYRCYCAPQPCDGHCRDLSPGKRVTLEAQGVAPAIRFRAPDVGQTCFDDCIYHTQVVENGILDDVILLRPDGSPTYHLTSVVDDHEMAITHVFSGHKLIDTAVHLHLCAAFGWDPPRFAHLPPIVTPGGESSMPLGAYRERGYLPLAIVNQLARLGWSPRGKRELLALDELAERFELGRVSHSPSMFDVTQLDWFNRRYLAQVDEATVTRLLVPYWHSAYGLADRAEGTAMTSAEWQRTLALSVRDEVHALCEVVDRVRFAFVDAVEPDAEAAQVLVQPYAPEVLSAFVQGVSMVAPFTFGPIDAYVSDLRWHFKASHGIRSRDVMYVIRAALTGQLDGPCLVDACQLLGQRRCVERVGAVLAAYQRA